MDDMKGMWDGLPGHTFIRGLWRVSAIPLPGHPGKVIESYELLTEDPDALSAAEARITALEAANATLRAALEDIARRGPKSEPVKGYQWPQFNGAEQELVLKVSDYADESVRYELAQIARKALDGGGL